MNEKETIQIRPGNNIIYHSETMPYDEIKMYDEPEETKTEKMYSERNKNKNITKPGVKIDNTEMENEKENEVDNKTTITALKQTQSDNKSEKNNIEELYSREETSGEQPNKYIDKIITETRTDHLIEIIRRKDDTQNMPYNIYQEETKTENAERKEDITEGTTSQGQLMSQKTFLRKETEIQLRKVNLEIVNIDTPAMGRTYNVSNQEDAKTTETVPKETTTEQIFSERNKNKQIFNEQNKDINITKADIREDDTELDNEWDNERANKTIIKEKKQTQPGNESEINYLKETSSPEEISGKVGLTGVTENSFKYEGAKIDNTMKIVRSRVGKNQNETSIDLIDKRKDGGDITIDLNEAIEYIVTEKPIIKSDIRLDNKNENTEFKEIFINEETYNETLRNKTEVKGNLAVFDIFHTNVTNAIRSENQKQIDSNEDILTTEEGNIYQENKIVISEESLNHTYFRENPINYAENEDLYIEKNETAFREIRKLETNSDVIESKISDFNMQTTIEEKEMIKENKTKYNLNRELKLAQNKSKANFFDKPKNKTTEKIAIEESFETRILIETEKEIDMEILSMEKELEMLLSVNSDIKNLSNSVIKEATKKSVTKFFRSLTSSLNVYNFHKEETSSSRNKKLNSGSLKTASQVLKLSDSISNTIAATLGTDVNDDFK